MIFHQPLFNYSRDIPCMRLPTMDGHPDSRKIDRDATERMIERAIDGGINYFDTAYIYHDGASELILGDALRGHRRDQVKIATKCPLWLIQQESDFDWILKEQLRRLRTDHIDFYLFHHLDGQRWKNVVPKWHLLEKAESALASGKIRHLGFSFHGDYESFAEIIKEYDHWTFCQIQYNYLDTENQAGTRGLKLAASTGLAVVIMEPLLGGRLANPPDTVSKVFERALVRRPPADWALRWLWNQPEVSVVLSGMSSMKQMEENLASATAARSSAFQAPDFNLIAQLQKKYRERAVVPCTKCSYCLPCPNGVDVPAVFEIYNEAFLHEDTLAARFKYQVFIPQGSRADACQDCHTCEDRCPQKIPISQWMRRVHALLGEAAAAA